VVDEEKQSCQQCSDVLGGAGCEVSTTSDPVRGLQLVQRERYDFILVDNKSGGAGDEDYVRSLRQQAQGASIIVLADRPTVDDAVRTMKRGATDYLAKPLEAASLLSAIQRGLEQRQHSAPRPTRAARIEPVVDDEWRPASGELSFDGELWLQTGQDTSRRAGLFLPRQERAALRVVALAPVGSCVTRGLPMALLERPDGERRPLLAPFDGRVIEHRGDEASAGVVPVHGDWLLRLLPLQAPLPVPDGRHTLVLLDPDDRSRQRNADRLRTLGLVVRAVTSPKEAVHALHCDRCDLLVVAAGNTGSDGPDQLAWMRTVVPDTRVVVLGDAGSSSEAAWRAQGISYWAAPPLDDGELSDLFAALLRPRVTPFLRRVAPHRNTPPWLWAVETTNGRGRKVRILADSRVLPAEHGVGLHLVNGLLNACRPISTRFGERSLDGGLVDESLSEFDRVVVIEAADAGGVPGSLVLADESVGGSSHPRQVTLTFQADLEQPGGLAYRDSTSAAIASYIHRCVEEL